MEYFTGTKGATDETRHEATEACHGRIEGDLGPGQDVGDPGPRDQLRQTGAGRGDAGDGAPGGREHHADRAGRAGGARLLPDPSRSAEMGPRGGLGLHRRPEGQGEAPPTQRRGTGRGPAEVLCAAARHRGLLRRTVGENLARRLRAEIHRDRPRCGAGLRRVAVCRVSEDGVADGPEPEGLPGAVPRSVRAVCDLSGHHPPGR